MNEALKVKIAEIGDMLTHKFMRMATAESCTGGMVAEMLTSVEGASKWFNGGLVTYTGRWKERILNVQDRDQIRFGLVSPQVALAMAEGLKAYQVEAGIAITGNAGPGKCDDDRDVGTVYIACFVQETTIVDKRVFFGDRDDIRTRAAEEAILMLHWMLVDYCKRQENV